MLASCSTLEVSLHGTPRDQCERPSGSAILPWQGCKRPRRGDGLQDGGEVVASARVALMAPQDQVEVSRPVDESIEAVAALHAAAEDKVGRPQRAIERMTEANGRP